jgi:hypothetical protein
MQQEIERQWIENQLLRNHIIDSGWMSEQAVDAALERGRMHPKNVRSVREHFALSEQMLAELGLAEWLEAFDRMYPHSD